MGNISPIPRYDEEYLRQPKERETTPPNKYGGDVIINIKVLASDIDTAKDIIIDKAKRICEELELEFVDFLTIELEN